MRATVAILLLGAVLAAIPLMFADAHFLQIATLVLLSAYLGYSWNILGGFAGQLSLGHAAFFGAGAYVATLLQFKHSWNPWAGMIAAVACGAVLSWLLGFPSFRLRGPYYTLTTIAFAELTRIGVQNTREVMGWQINGARGLLIPSLGEAPLQFQSLHKAFYYEVVLGMLVVVVLTSLWMRRGKLGHEWVAVREDELAAAGLGIDVRRAKLRAAAISGAFTAAGGVFYAQLVLYVDPARVLGLDLSVESAVVALAGGAGTIVGPILGALVLRPIAELLQLVSGTSFRGLHLVLYGAALILVASRFPRGIAGVFWKHGRTMQEASLRRQE